MSKIILQAPKWSRAWIWLIVIGPILSVAGLILGFASAGSTCRSAVGPNMGFFELYGTFQGTAGAVGACETSIAAVAASALTFIVLGLVLFLTGIVVRSVIGKRANAAGEQRFRKQGVKRRSVLQGAVAFITAALAGAAPAYANGNVRYVSASGSDGNPGSVTAPWRTLAKVRSAMASGELQRGSTVLFKRGHEFYGSIHMPSLIGSAGSLTIGAYGEGARPRLLGYKVSNAAWTPYSGNIWKLNIAANSGQYSGNTSEPSTNVGFLKAAGIIHGRKRWSISELAADWEFFSDSTNVYVRLGVNPGAGVAISVQRDILRLASHTTVQDLYLGGTGAHGVATGGKNVLIQRNEIEWIGGSALSGTTRYGNGVELYVGAARVMIRENVIRQTYDVALSAQGTGTAGWTDITWDSNRIENCNMTLELWGKGGGTGFLRCRFVNNTCIDAGYSWAALIRSDRDGKGTHLLTYSMEVPVDVEITGNSFLGARDNYTRNSGDRQIPAGIVTHGNTIKLGAGKKIAYGVENPEISEQAAQWQARTGREQASVFAVSY